MLRGDGGDQQRALEGAHGAENTKAILLGDTFISVCTLQIVVSVDPPDKVVTPAEPAWRASYQ